MHGLPHSTAVNIAILSSVFNKVTTSYKHLFFQAILEVLSDSAFKTTSISFHELHIKMLVLSWFPNRYCRLSFGYQDMISELLSEISDDIDLDKIAFGENAVKQIETRIRQSQIAKNNDLCRYVPFRLISPFFEADLRGLADHKKNNPIAIFSNERFHSAIPLYRLTPAKNPDSIDIHPAWLQYLKDNFSIVSGWAHWHWVEFLQARNPTVPAISDKIYPPLVRGKALTDQRAYWSSAIDSQAYKCIFSGESLSTYELDHFLPWSFIGHNQFWNLIPIFPGVNSSKNNRIPASQFVEPLAELHFDAYIRHHGKLKSKFLNEYLDGLRITPDYLEDKDRFVDAYVKTLTPLIATATQCGFSSGWYYKP